MSCFRDTCGNDGWDCFIVSVKVASAVTAIHLNCACTCHVPTWNRSPVINRRRPAGLILRKSPPSEGRTYYGTISQPLLQHD